MPITPRLCAVLLSTIVAGVAAPASAGFADDPIVIVSRTTIDAKSFGDVLANCPLGHKLVAQSITAHKPDSMIVLAQKPLLIDGTSPTSDGVHGPPTGALGRAYNNDALPQDLDLQVLCNRFDTELGGAAVQGTVNVVTKQYGEGTAACPDGHVATGGGYETGQLAVFGHYLAYLLAPQLPERADGVHEAATAWTARAANPGTTTQSLRTYAYCYRPGNASIQVNVASLLLKPGERRFLGIYAGAAYVLGGGMYGGDESLSMSDAALRTVKDGETPRGFSFTTGPDQAHVAPGGIFGVFVRDLRPSLAAKAAVPTKVAVVVVASSESAPPTTIVPAIEYYNAARDHYFVTSIAREISDLDAGVHPGWTRTGEAFNVYAAGSGGPPGRLPMCRYYGLPEAGLDSHFYTASVLECLDVGAKFAGAWALESGQVFQVHFPNIETGECPAGTTAVLRTWNSRADSNHRYMVKPALRSEMLAKGHVSEGYGPLGTAFCVPA
ncbi:MAG: hypothetical protein U1F15_13965 [Burkholderiales bacterium]